MCGITPYHVHILCKNPYDGGFGYNPRIVGKLSLDEICMLFADKDNLRRRNGRVRSIESLEGVNLQTKDGFIKGVAADGTTIKGTIKGKSLVQKIREEAQKKREEEARQAEAEAAKQNKRRHRRGK